MSFCGGRRGAPGVLHVDDLASACLFLLENYDAERVNVGVGSNLTIMELWNLVRSVVGYTSDIAETGRAGGAPRRLLDSRTINALGWEPTIGLKDGIHSTYERCVEEQPMSAV